MIIDAATKSNYLFSSSAILRFTKIEAPVSCAISCNAFLLTLHSSTASNRTKNQESSCYGCFQSSCFLTILLFFTSPRYKPTPNSIRSFTLAHVELFSTASASRNSPERRSIHGVTVRRRNPTHSHSASARQLPCRFSRWLVFSLPFLALGQRQIPRETRYSWSVEGCFSTRTKGENHSCFFFLDVSVPSPPIRHTSRDNVARRWYSRLSWTPSSKSLRTSLTSFPRRFCNSPVFRLQPSTTCLLLSSISFSHRLVVSFPLQFLRSPVSFPFSISSPGCLLFSLLADFGKIFCDSLARWDNDTIGNSRTSTTPAIMLHS